MAQLPISPGEDHHGAAYYIRQGTEPAPTLPLRSSPMRFAVMRKDGLSSNAWRVWVDPAGDAYVLCRDHMKEMKASLHQSGKQHIAFTSKTGIEMTKGSRFWNQWTGNSSRLRGRVGLQSKFRAWLPLCERPDGP